MLTERRVLITGGAGFIGSHLCERLLERGDEVLCVDNFFTGTRRNVHHLLSHPRFELTRHDICFPLYVEVDQIFNLACPASPIHYQFDPVQTTKVSVVGSINMLGLAKRVKAQILQASTSEVYGDPAVHPQQESYWGNVNPIGPRSCYDEGKRCAETLFFDYRRQHKLPIKVARICVIAYLSAVMRSCVSTISSPGRGAMSIISCRIRDLSSLATISAFRFTSRLTRSSISLVRPHPSTISSIRCKPPRSA